MLTVLTEDNDILFVGENNFEQKVLEENHQYLEGYFAALVDEAQKNQQMK